MKKISFIKNVKVVDDGNNKIVLKKRKRNINDIYSILDNRKFENYLIPIEIDNDYEKYPFINENKIEDSDKSQDIIYLMSLLHNKTTSYENINIDEIKKIYEDSIDELEKIDKHYLELQDEIEMKILVNPAELLLMKNISKVFFMLNLSRKNIEEYYKVAKEKINIRKALVHGNLSLNHILESDEKYLISWNKAKKDIPVYDLVKFYKNEFNTIEFNSLYEEYNRKYQLTTEEEYLFLSLINRIELIEMKEDIFNNTLRVRKLVDYIDKTIKFTLEKNKENEETN